MLIFPTIIMTYVQWGGIFGIYWSGTKNNIKSTRMTTGDHSHTHRFRRVRLWENSLSLPLPLFLKQLFFTWTLLENYHNTFHHSLIHIFSSSVCCNFCLLHLFLYFLFMCFLFSFFRLFLKKKLNEALVLDLAMMIKAS